MKQFFEKYTLWEDYLNGMYDSYNPLNEENYVSLSISLLTNCDLFLSICISMIHKWPVSSKVNLTNKSCNRKAWLGHAACNYRYKIPEVCTRIAWIKLTEEQRQRANTIALHVIKTFEEKYEAENK